MAEEKTLKDESILSIVKTYAENHTALFTAICSGLVAFLTLVLKLCSFSYQYGKLMVFHININTIDSNKDTTIFTVLFYIIGAGVMLISNYFGYLFYRKNALTKYLLILYIFSIVISFFFFPYILNVNILDIITDLEYWVLILVFSLFIVPSINLIVIVNAFSPSINDLYCRLESKYNKINQKYNIDNTYKQKHIKRYTIKLNNLLLKKEKLEKRKNKSKNSKHSIRSLLKLSIQFIFTSQKKIPKTFNLKIYEYIPEQIKKHIENHKLELKKEAIDEHKNTNLGSLIKICILLFIFVLILIMFFIIGNNQSKNIVKIDIIENTSYFVENENKIDCAIIYENEEYIIVSPCYEENNKLIINTSYQYRIENSNITKHNITYDAINVTQFDDLTEYYKTE